MTIHERRIYIIKMKLALKGTEALRQIWEGQDQGEHGADIFEAVRRILIARGEKIAA
jgi:hypothetical protein